MESVLKSVLEEELERNIHKQVVFSNELSKYPKGSLVVSSIHGDSYLYRRYREGNKIKSEYIGPMDGEKAKKAYECRAKYIKIKEDLKNLLVEEKSLRKAIKIYNKGE